MSARAHRKLYPDDAIVIALPMQLSRTEPIVLRAQNSGRKDAPLILRGAPKGGSTITGAITLASEGGLDRSAEPVSRMPGAVRDRVRRLRIGEDVAAKTEPAFTANGSFAQSVSGRLFLFEGDRRLELAHWPSTGYAASPVVVAGEGPAKKELVERAARLRNVRFLPFQPYARLSDFLGLADVHVLPQAADAADLVLPSRLGGMLASGQRIVATAAPGTELAIFLDGAAIIVAPGDTTTASGRLVFGIFAALAEFEHKPIRERTMAGLSSARARGRNGGRPCSMTSAKLRLAQMAMAKRDTKVSELCMELDVTRQTLYRFVDPKGELRADGPKLL